MNMVEVNGFLVKAENYAIGYTKDAWEGGFTVNAGDIVELDDGKKYDVIVDFDPSTDNMSIVSLLLNALGSNAQMHEIKAVYSRKEIEPEEPETIPGFDEAIDALHALTIKKEDKNNEN